MLFGVAYRITGSVADADDVLQDAWLRWTDVDTSAVAAPRPYLVSTVTNTALNRLRSARARRESYVGPWLPEPVFTGPDLAEDVAAAESVSMALLVVLETLSPLERAVFVLREAFGFPFGEIARSLGRSEPTVRQLARRAREHVQARRPRFQQDRGDQRRVTEAFLAACGGGDLSRLMSLLSPGVSLVSDSGGKAKAPRRTITGARKVARFLVAVAGDGASWKIRFADINGRAGIVGYDGGEPVAAILFDITEGRIERMHLINNPDKLGALGMDSAPRVS